MQLKMSEVILTSRKTQTKKICHNSYKNNCKVFVLHALGDFLQVFMLSLTFAEYCSIFMWGLMFKQPL